MGLHQSEGHISFDAVSLAFPFSFSFLSPVTLLSQYLTTLYQLLVIWRTAGLISGCQCKITVSFFTADIMVFK